MRIVGHNVNSLHMSNRAKIHTIMKGLHKMECYMALLNETSVNCRIQSVKQEIRDTVSMFWENTKITMSCVPDECQSWYQPGGTTSIVQGGIIGRVCEAGTDVNGRWSWYTLLGERGK